MRIQKIINNNVVSALDGEGREIVAMGRGIGFQKKAGQELSEEAVEKVFRLESPVLLERFKELLANMPLECAQVSDAIISYARERLPLRLNQNVYLTLTDHIDFALKRHAQGMLFENALYREIKRFYPEEFEIGLYALDLIAERTGVRLPADEAASIAFHLVNGEFGGMKLRDTQVMTELIRHLMELVGVEHSLPEDSIQADRLASNLKFMLSRLLQGKPVAAEPDETFNTFVRGHCRREYELAGKMKDYITSVTECIMTEEEVIYMTLQLKYAVQA
ncbi:MAG: PRD domain-containing protein [Eubacteriales bacterium]|nr:PRD domain-containing protein [Eubacteriales bacterium]